MRTQLKTILPEAVLTRVLDALGQELVDASDDELMEAAKELGMDLQMKGSAAFLGLTFTAKWRLADVFDVEALKQQLERQARRSKLSTDRKGSDHK